jgi:hypothetical protein
VDIEYDLTKICCRGMEIALLFKLNITSMTYDVRSGNKALVQDKYDFSEICCEVWKQGSGTN